MSVDRDWLTNAQEDSGSGTDGDILNKSFFSVFVDAVDVALTTAGTGDVVGPASSVDDRIATFDGTTGKLLQDGGQTIAQVIAAGGSGAVSLLHANSGTNTSAGAANVDTVAISGLTAKDRLLTVLVARSITQQTAGTISLYNATDGILAAYLNLTGALTAGVTLAATVMSQQQQHAATAVSSFTQGASSVSVDVVENATFTTAWTGSWTLALRHGGVTAGGTFQYTWAVYKLAGQ